MQKIYIYPNPQKAPCVQAALIAVRWLESRNISVAISSEVALFPEFEGLSTAYTDAELAVVLGGDGTMLRCAHQLIGRNIPLLGVNYGHLGYLTELSPDQLIPALEKVLDGHCRIEKRSMLQGLLNDRTQPLKRILAINDLCIYRGSIPGMISYAAYINDTYMDTYRADGALISTPNGSTAYNFSVGGPIVNPLAKNMIFTPICSHSLLSRSIVLSENDRLRLEAAQGADSRLPTLSADGIEFSPLTGTFSLEITLATEQFSLVRVSNRNFYDILREKMIR